jgi:hypothetical protein
LAIRIKFRCKAVAEREAPNHHPFFDANFFPVTDDCPENDRVFRGIAGGQIHLVGLDKKEFEAGEDYWIEFTKAEKGR